MARLIPILLLTTLLLAGLAYAEPAIYEAKHLNVTLYADGYAWIEYNIEVYTPLPYIKVELFGSGYEDLLVVGEEGIPLDYNVTEGGVEVATLGLRGISISYFTQDLTNKTGRVWAFTIDPPINTTVTLPKELTVVGLNKTPLSIGYAGDKIALVFPSGRLALSYIVFTTQDRADKQDQASPSYISLAFFGLAAIVAAASTIVILKRRMEAKRYRKEERTIDVEKIIASRPDLRPDDKEVLRFLAEAGGEAFEAELRSRFNLPKTSMWRMVKRLKREGLVDVKKVGGQNLVYIRRDVTAEGGTDVPTNS